MEPKGPEMPESMDQEKAEYSPYELKDMAETLQKAAEIQADPDLMTLLKPLLEKKVKAIRSLADLKARSQELSQSDMESPAEDAAPESEA